MSSKTEISTDIIYKKVSELVSSFRNKFSEENSKEYFDALMVYVLTVLPSEFSHEEPLRLVLTYLRNSEKGILIQKSS